jgi:BirA family biotin operon repressor/biotin-[acetyl-CoA-carboxylase] ligase
VATALGERPVRTYVAVVSSEAEAMRWARADAPEGAVVVGQIQLGLRDRNGFPWPVRGECSLAFSVILKPKLPPIRAGRLYLAGMSALLESMPGPGMVEWPDTRQEEGKLLSGVVTRVSSGVAGIDWAIVTFYVAECETGRAELMAQLMRSFDEHWARPDPVLVGFYKERCATIDRRIRATFLPLGPRARQVEGMAVDITPGGGLVVVVTDDSGNERKVTLQINDIGRMEYLKEDGTVESSDQLSSSLGSFWPLQGDVAPPSGEGWTP